MAEKISNTLKAIRGLEGDVAVLKTDVAVLKTDVAVLKTDVAVLKTDVAELKTGVTEVRDDLRVTNHAVERLYDRQVQGEIRLSTEIVAVASMVREVRDLLVAQTGHGPRLDALERRVDALERDRE